MDFNVEQELFIVSSLGTIIIHIVRYKLVSENGIPLGLLMSGFEFSRFPFFWSSAFLSGIFLDPDTKEYHAKERDGVLSARRSRRWNIYFMCFVFLCGIIAVLAGPSTALLLVPDEVVCVF